MANIPAEEEFPDLSWLQIMFQSSMIWNPLAGASHGSIRWYCSGTARLLSKDRTRPESSVWGGE